MHEASFGNWTKGLPLRNLEDTYAELTIPDFVNISVFDNTSTYGDNRADMRFGNEIVGFSQDEITFNYINHYYIHNAFPILVNQEGDFMFLEGEGFVNTPALNCKFGNLLATSVKFYNSTKIHCGTPVVTDKTVPYTVAVTLNGIEYLYFINPKTGLPYTLSFTGPIVVNSIDPFMGFSNALNVEVAVQADGVLDLPTLSCKIHDYVS